MAVVTKPKPAITKGDLSAPGWIGIYLGRSPERGGASNIGGSSRTIADDTVLCSREYMWYGTVRMHG